MPKIYTRTGDDGTTALFGGDRVGKGHPRIRAYGTVDEVNALVGVARAHLADTDATAPLHDIFQEIQEDLFVVGADLATPENAKPVVPRITEAHIDGIEQHIDTLEDDLAPLKHFVLPGGSPAAAALHNARTVCRRAERLSVEASASTPLNEHALVYLNRLSDLLFVMARWANHAVGASEHTWVPDTSSAS
ncbi:ATP:cob(I)alamin adenosyltransferase [Longimonas halophila]|uniref:Corrinoid adenosyltransferase n=1 Tax=Longimonas halophila TaxID=1469170 RepID=A0A2H3NXD6_9BACT|nr:cob(I)yrinic acid a,c-diamide adenosyltransferase [Longimonas halophila]PEN09604.1 ATP:cob(I)alamin adenosyltransferase [Longimonas halophila]